MTVLKCSNASFAYDGVKVLENVNFEIDEGDYLCVVGENGSGKSTLIKGILRLKKLDSGSISFSGVSENEIGYLSQQNQTQKDFPASVWEVVLSGRMNSLKLRPFYNKEDKAEAKEKMAMLGIEKLKSRSVAELSGGQRQRVLLARALCASKKLLLLDEPAAGLDPIVTSELYELIKKINKDYGVTMIMVTHDIPAAVGYANKILYLGEKEQFFGTAEEYRNSAVYKKFYSGNDV